jgi:cytochrome c556
MKLEKIVVAVLSVGIAAGALAQAKPEDEIRYRQSVMNVVSRAFGPMIAMAQDKIPYNKDVVAKNSNVIETLVGLPWASFGPGTDKGAPTKADMKIWSEQAKFKDASEKLQQIAAKLAQTAKGGDEKAVKAVLGDMGKACKACHDDFRLKDFRT